MTDEVYGRRKWVIEQAPGEEEEDEETLEVSAQTKNLESKNRKFDFSSRVGKKAVVTKDVLSIMNTYLTWVLGT